jgi:M6 family metalloprotease-like protein
MAEIVLKTPDEALFVGSYAKVPVIIDPKLDLKIDDLDFKIPSGLAGGVVSLSRDRDYNPEKPDIMLCVGYEPGTHIVQALKRGTDSVVGEAKFESTTLWNDDKFAPSLWFTGIVEGYAARAAWGGGSSGPQNIDVRPATGTRRLAILLVDTSSQRYTTNATDLQAIRDRWMGEVVNGITGADGITRSVKAFYQEVSYGNLDISAQVFGPVQLSGNWDNYFELDVNGNWAPKATYWQACVTAGDSLINYTNFDMLICVSQEVPATATTAARAAWPYGGSGTFTTAEGNRSLGVVSMPSQWGASDAREVHETLCHELGHTLGLGDQYTPEVPGRNPGNWEMMHGDDAFPHFSIAHRMMLGWVRPEWLQTYNFASIGAPVDQTITLHPIEQGTPPAGRRSGVEIRIADGWNYYLEYRTGQAAQIGDRNLPEDSRVLGTDVVSGPYTPPIARPAILLLAGDPDGDGSVLGNGDDYEETDTTDPTYPTDFRIDVSGIDGSKADARIRYGVNSKPDPSIRPWPASPDRQWQSPDIEIRNARNATNSAWFNVPWVGNANTVVARVKNNGTLAAPQVRVNFYVKNYNVGGTPETFLGSEVRDIAAGATVEFTTTWTPPNEGHYCIVVRIPLYQLPSNPAVVEMTELNNLAQSNYDRFISRTSSPPSREVTTVEVGNPYDRPTRVFIRAGQTNPFYRTYLEHMALKLDPGETRLVKVMFESLLNPNPDSPIPFTAIDYDYELEQRYRKIPNNVGIYALIEDPRDEQLHTTQVLGGAQAQIATGRATKVQDFGVEGNRATGTVVTLDDGSPVINGKVIIIVTLGKDDSQRKTYIDATVSDGKFSEILPPDWTEVEAYYNPDQEYADSSSKSVTRHKSGCSLAIIWLLVCVGLLALATLIWWYISHSL